MRGVDAFRARWVDLAWEGTRAKDADFHFAYCLATRFLIDPERAIEVSKEDFVIASGISLRQLQYSLRRLRNLGLLRSELNRGRSMLNRHWLKLPDRP